MEYWESLVTTHTGPLLDVATDSIGSHVATACSDGSVQVFEIKRNSPKSLGQLASLCKLAGHENGEVIRLAWAPSRDVLAPLATSGTDNRVIIWKEDKGVWEQIYKRQFPDVVLSMEWCPQELGSDLACACADGHVYVLNNTTTKQSWSTNDFVAHQLPFGCTGVSWSPYLPQGALTTMPLSSSQVVGGEQNPTPSRHMPVPVSKLVTCGGGSGAKIWSFLPQEKKWLFEKELRRPGASSSLILDAAWASNIGIPISYVATGSEEGFVTIWLSDEDKNDWRYHVLPQFESSVTRVSWSLVGTYLLVTCTDGTASLWKETTSGDWVKASSIHSDTTIFS